MNCVLAEVEKSSRNAVEEMESMIDAARRRVDQDHEAMLPDLFFGDSGAGCY